MYSHNLKLTYVIYINLITAIGWILVLLIEVIIITKFHSNKIFDIYWYFSSAVFLQLLVFRCTSVYTAHRYRCLIVQKTNMKGTLLVYDQSCLAYLALCKRNASTNIKTYVLQSKLGWRYTCTEYFEGSPHFSWRALRFAILTGTHTIRLDDLW